MTMRDPERSFTRREEKRLLESAAALLRSRFPQPDSTRCPSKWELKNLATRRRGFCTRVLSTRARLIGQYFENS